MTEQFQVGKVYPTRGGDRVRVTEIRNRGLIYPVCGDFLDGGAAGQHGAWTLGGKFSTAAIETPCDLLPGALPDPAAADDDDKAELLAALRAPVTDDEWNEAYLAMVDLTLSDEATEVETRPSQRGAIVTQILIRKRLAALESK